MSATTPRMANMPMTAAVSCNRAITAATPYLKGLGRLRKAYQMYRNTPTAAASTAHSDLTTVSWATSGETRSKDRFSTPSGERRPFRSSSRSFFPTSVNSLV